MSMEELRRLLADKPNVFGSTTENERFYSFVMTEYLKQLQSIHTYENMISKQRENARKNADLPFHDLLDLEGRYNAKTALGIAFGPSLMINQSRVLAGAKKCKTFAVDRGMEWYYQNGVKLDVVVTADAYSSADWINDNHDLTGVKLIAYVGSNHEFIAKFIRQGGAVYYFNYKCRVGTDDELNAIFPVKTYIPVAGNVGYILISVCMSIFKPRKLILVGFDNSWGEYYYPGIKDDAMPKQHTMTDITGRDVYTSDGFLLYNLYMQELVYQYHLEDQVINCTEGGLLRLKHNHVLKDYV